MNEKPAIFEDFKIRRFYDEKTEVWYFSVVDIVRALLHQPDFQTARKYWNKLKERLHKEGSQLVTNCHQLKMLADDGKMRLTDVATPDCRDNGCHRHEGEQGCGDERGWHRPEGEGGA